MSRVYIEDFEIPETCSKCPFIKYWDCDNETSCKASRKFLWNAFPDKMRHPDCPLKFK